MAVLKIFINKKWLRTFLEVFFPALQIQLSLVIGFGLSLLVSIFYYFLDDARYPAENPYLLLIGLLVSSVCFLLGEFGSKILNFKNHINLRRGAWIVVLAWLFACFISTLIYFLAGFPDPARVHEFSFTRRLIDAFYESLSGFATVGTSILPSVEVFPRGLLFWRTMTQGLGGMGIAFLVVTIWKGFTVNRSEIINSELGTPYQIRLETEKEVVQSGVKFLKVYLFLFLLLAFLLTISGFIFRKENYFSWYDNLYDALNFAISTISTGGFTVYDDSVGLQSGGLQNPISEWVIAFFMVFASLNFALWHEFIFKKKWKVFWKSTETKVFFGMITFFTLIIFSILNQQSFYNGTLETLRYSFFNVATILSTTGLANQNFTVWPIQAQGFLFACYLTGGCLGSTAGGLLIHRFLVLYRYTKTQIHNLIYGKNKTWISVDGIKYNDRSAAIVILSMILFYMTFLAGSVLLMMTSYNLVSVTGETSQITLETAFTASLANLGGIGPAAVAGTANAGPVGNYSAFSLAGKVLLGVLMFTGRIGVLSLLMLFITRRGQLRYSKQNVEEQVNFDADEFLF
jgi:trk system potassium uptake protein